jgi:hypothetical protein
MTYGATVWIIM